MNTIRSFAPSIIGRRSTGLAAGLVLLLFALVGCGQEARSQSATTDQARKKPTPVVSVETIRKAPLTQTLALTGAVEAGRIAQLASPAEGPVLGVRVREGDRVTRGQVLLDLGRTEGATALVTSLREDLKKEEDNLARTRRLVGIGALAGEQLDSAAANVARMRAQLIKAQETTRDYAVRAPWAGVVAKLKVRDGDFVAPRAPLAELYDPNSLLVRLAIPEQNVAGVTHGMKAMVELDAYPGRRFAGSVTGLYPYLDPHTRTRTAEITLADAPLLLPGMFARVDLVRETVADAMMAPAYSLVAAPGSGFTAFVVQDGQAVRRQVETGVEVDGRVRIVAGLEEGDRLIVAGQENLKDGAAVKVVEVDGKKTGGDGAKPEAQPPVPGQGASP